MGYYYDFFVVFSQLTHDDTKLEPNVLLYSALFKPPWIVY